MSGVLVVDTRPLCLASHPRDSFVCELPEGHDGRHRAVDLRRTLLGEEVRWNETRRTVKR